MGVKINLLYIHKIDKYNQMGGTERALSDLAEVFDKDKDFNLSVILDNYLLTEELAKNGGKVYTLPLRNYILFAYTYSKFVQVINTLLTRRAEFHVL